MQRTTPRAALAAALALVLAALALAACGDEGENTTAASSSATTTTEADTTSEGGAGDTPQPNGFDAQKVFAEASPSVVTVRSVFGSGNGFSGGQGSGFVIDTDGEVVTNAHVVTDAQASGGGASGGDDVSQADEVFVEFADRNQVPAKIVGVDLNADVALLELDSDGLKLDALELGDSDAVEVGEPVAAIGSPFGQDQSLSTGIVSATDRAIDSLTDFKIDGGIQTDASINPGNSGGPLIDPNGQVIGINQQINTTSGGNEGVGYAVPSNLVQRSIDDLRDDGKAEYPFIGVQSIPLYPQLAEQLDIDAPTGSLIVEITPDSPAADAGLKGAGDNTIDFQGQEVETGGDTIVSVDGTELVGESDLSRLISRFRPGDTIELGIIRDGKETDVDVTLKARPSVLAG